MRPREGVALVASLGLLMLGAALLAGTWLASLELRRAVRGRVAGARAAWETQHVAASLLQQWGPELDSMPVGATRERVMSPPTDGPVTHVVARVRRLAVGRYAAALSVRVGADRPAGALAHRRVRLLLERAPRDSTDSTAPPRAVMPIARWRVVDVW
jgi:hypothetical protein